jgi:superfamily II DNA or RNA helicase
MRIPQQSSQPVCVGDHVRARRQRWTVLALQAFEHCTLLTLKGAEAANSGVERRVLTPFDRVEPIEKTRRLRIVHRRAWQRMCRALIGCDGSSGILRTALAARMELLPHQLEPALAVVRGRASRLLIADAVGLGKTIEAGLIVAELVARGAATRVLVLTPAGLREQWIEELAHRFHLEFVMVDLATTRHLRRTVPPGINPLSVEPLVVSSVDYVKRPDVLPAILSCRWDVVVVDEAHQAVSDSERHRAVSAVCRLAPYVLLLTATPHNGDPMAFASLCGIGGQGDELCVFRRTRTDVGLKENRRVHQVLIRPNRAERDMHECVARFAETVEREHEGTGLALATLKKRALSSAYSLQQTVERRLAQLERAEASGFWQPALEILSSDGEFDAADASPAWMIPGLGDVREEHRLLSRVAEAAGRAMLDETKLAALRRLLRRLREPVVLFTEYRDTLNHVRERVAPEAAVLHGGLSREERRAALAQFALGRNLLATDAAGEGLNLHDSGRVVINLELPWNPMRLEQRIGRVDRIGQRRRVHAFHLVAADTDEMTVRDRLLARLRRARADIGTPDPFGETIEDATPSTGTRLMRLTAAAETEAARIRQAKSIMAAGLVLPTGGPYALLAPGRRLRALLGTQTLVLFEACFRDATGEVVASHLTAVLYRGMHGAIDLARMEALAGQVSDPWLTSWREETIALHTAFWLRRCTRERAIAAVAAEAIPVGTQPGLFDRRADQARVKAAEHRAEAAAAARAQIDLAGQRARLLFAPPVPMLVLVP